MTVSKYLRKSLALFNHQCINASENPTKVAILGTSNSVMRDGYIVGLKEAEGIDIAANVSLGSSHAPMVAYRLPDLDGIEIDVLILDLCVNEQRALYRDLYDLHVTTKVFNFIIGWCADRNVTPVILINPDKRAFDDVSVHPHANEVHSHYVQMCENARISYFDGFDVIKRIADEKFVKPDALFKDAFHMAPSVAQRLGRLLGNTIRDISPRPSTKLRLGRYHRYRYISVPENGTVERKTSIASIRFARMGLSSRVDMECQPPINIVAVVLNMSQTNAALRISSGDGVITKRFDNAYYDPSRSLWLVIWSLLKPLHVADGNIHLSVVASSLGSAQEDNDHSRLGQVPSEGLEPIVEVAGFIVETPKQRGFQVIMKMQSVRLADGIAIDEHRTSADSAGA